MLYPFLTGLLLGLSLIVAIGAQNAFVLRQGILRRHVFYIALFCSTSDSLLITIGVSGISYFFNEFINEYSKVIFGFSSLWLFFYGLLRLRSVYKDNYNLDSKNSESSGLFSTLSILSVLTFANPHVYLDTMILIGSVSQQFEVIDRTLFTFGACLSSFIWFFSLAYGAKFLTPYIQSSFHWRVLDTLIALIMFIIAYNLAIQGGWK